MKKSLIAIFIIVVLLGALITCCNVSNGQFAYADEVAWQPSPTGDGITWYVGESPVYLYTVTDKNGTPVGVRMYALYFGASRIPVVAEVYSTKALVIDFKINATNLTPEQQQTRNTLITLFSNVSKMIDDVDDCANTNYSTSDIYRYNEAKQGETVDVSYYTYDMLTYARRMYTATDGAFNPAVYRIVDLWGFSSRIYSYGNFYLPYDREVTRSEFLKSGYPLPEQKYVEAFSNPNFTDFSDTAVTISDNGNGTYSVTKNVSPAVVDGVEYQQWLDLGGVAKGYVTDKAREMIRELGIDRFYVNAGSSSITMGYEYDGSNTVFTMQDAFDPFSLGGDPLPLFSVKIGKSSISTSGQYVRKYTVDGVEYAHIIDGTTGAPAQTGVRSVMVVVPEEAGAFWATMGDCLTTALTVMGRNKIVEFANGFLKEQGIKIVVQYETLDGKKQLLSNYDEDEITPIAKTYPEFGWALKVDKDGNYYYDANATSKQTYTVLLAVLGSVLGAGVVALIVYHFLRGKKRTTANVANAKKDKPFKLLDVMMYMFVALVILVLFYVFVFDTDTAQMQAVTVMDLETGETLFMYNVTRNEYTINADNINGWQVAVVTVNDGLEVTFTRQIDGEEHFNTVKITRATPSVKMADSLCGFHQDCVRNFPAITRTGGTIVCSPNGLKVITA